MLLLLYNKTSHSGESNIYKHFNLACFDIILNTICSINPRIERRQREREREREREGEREREREKHALL